MSNNLAEIRKSFGFSQEQLAERMNKDVSTISRWERGKTREPIISPLIQTANRKYQYIRHMVDPELMAHVHADDGFSGLYYGSEMMIICVSKGKLRKYPFLRATYGFEAASYFKGEGKRLLEENIELHNRALLTPGSTALCFVPGNSSILIKEPFRIEFNFISKNLIYAVSKMLSAEEASAHQVGTIEYVFG